MNLLHFKFLPFDRAWTMNLHKKTLTPTEGLDPYSNTPINKQQTPKPPFKIFLILKLHTNEAWFDWGCAIQFS